MGDRGVWGGGSRGGLAMRRRLGGGEGDARPSRSGSSGGWGQGLRHRAPAPRVLPEGLWGARAGFQVHDVLLEMGQVQEDAFPVLE